MQMNVELMAMLTRISDEENKILQGQNGIDKHLYTEARDFTIDSKKMLEKGKLIDIRPHTRFVHFPCHKHNYIEIIYMCSGQTVHIINGATKVVLKEGDLLFLNQHSQHEIMPAGERDVAVNFMVLPEFFDVAFNMIEKENVIGSFLVSTLRQDTNEGQYLCFRVSDVVPVQNLVENMVWSIIHKQGNQRSINQYTMGLLFMQLLNYADKIDGSCVQQYENKVILSALKYVEENYKDANLTELAHSLNQSVCQLSRMVKASTGFTFKQLLQQKRLHKSVQLLMQTKLPILDIITAVGYDNTSYFYRIFKEQFGVSPKEYRQNAGN